jgi:Cu+-exporting ATPase
VAEADLLRQDGATAVFVAIDGHAAGAIAIADPGPLLSPVIAAAAMAASSVSVIANALRLNRVAL